MPEPQQLPPGWSTLPPGWSTKPATGGTATAPTGKDTTWDDYNKAVEPLTQTHPLSTPHTGNKLADAGINTLANVGAGGLGMVLHPIDTATGMAKTGLHAFETGTGIGDPTALYKDAKAIGQNVWAHPGEAIPSMIGQAAVGEVFGGLPAGGADVLEKVGGAAKRTGLDLGNSAEGAVGPRPFQYGHNPARGAYDRGVLPAWSKSSALKAHEDMLPKVGTEIGDLVNSTPNRIPLNDIRQSVENPLNAARGVARGPGLGGVGEPTIDALQESMKGKAPGAQSPIYGPGAGTPFTAPEAMRKILQESKRPLLPPPMEDVPLHPSPAPRNPRMSPMAFKAEVNPEEIAEPRSGNPLAPISEYPGINPHYLSGSEHPELSGRVTPLQNPDQVTTRMGILRRPMEFPPSNDPSPFMDLRHPEATAPDVWNTVKNIDEKTRYRQNQSPEVETTNELQKQVRGGLRGNLETAVPELKPLSQTYGDLATGRDSLERTLHSGTGLRKLLDVPMFPIETAVGRGLYEGGKAAQAAAPVLRKLSLPPGYGSTLAVAPKRKEQ